MKTILIILLLLLFGIISIQDFKYRAIHAYLLLGIAVVSVLINLLEPLLTLYEMLKSMAFLTCTSVGFMIYQTIKNKQLENPIDTSIGLGDILFFIAITPLFQIHNYIVFFISGLLISILLFVATKNLRKQPTIPLAGYLSLFLIICFGLKLSNLVNPFFIEF
ncbi:type IV leader peptidase family protein [Kordia periserrulae]|uniref:Type IV leader peptidase family protein n=1 Tax=Kordia periserrulae TaxID=701523 RepID=A0A2T6C6X7_9FLAO|nr:prepilin peptidase [Kordia periserrulae]PTX64081.1 type IV leader peptidase family protein [Kordia periserrulae]